MIRKSYRISIIVICLVVFNGCDRSNNNNTENPIFKLQSASKTGISFSNDLKEDVSSLSNVLDFDFFYNGSGVGVGDFNNDGLKDLFFSGNQVANALYINQDNLKFEDISESAGIEAIDSWCNGVSIIDINMDGWEDIYISVGGPHREPSLRKNLLFINNQDLTFTESAEEYGLADTGFSTQSVFFDFDNDGDQDIVVGNESYLYGYDPLTFYQKVGESEDVLHENSAHLYRNDNGKFIDITSIAGLLKPSFVLGMVSQDFNNDGALDIYITNDYFVPDALYINMKDGTFKDQTKNYFNQLAFFGMGMDMGDINKDGHEDIFVADMAASDHIRSKTLMESMNIEAFDFLTNVLDFPHQYMFNSVQVNNREGQFNSVAHQINMAKTDWSWSVDINDFDLDGSNDIYITNGYRKYAKDNDFRVKVSGIKKKYGNAVPNSIKQALYDEMPSEPLVNFMFSNKEGDWKDIGKDWGMNLPTFSNGSVSVDLDNDGDLDIVTNNIDDAAHVYENRINQKKPTYIHIGTSGVNRNYSFEVKLVFTDESEQVQSAKRTKGYFSSFPNEVIMSPYKEVSHAIITWYDGTSEIIDSPKVNSTNIVDKANATKSPTNNSQGVSTELKIARPFQSKVPVHYENRFNDFEEEVLLPYKQSTFGPIISSGISTKGISEYLFVGGSAGYPAQLYRNRGTEYDRLEVATFDRDKKSDDLGSVFFDYDNDGDLDLYVVSGGNEYESGSLALRDRLYRNDGDDNFKRVRMQAIDELRHSGKVVTASDLDNDGYIDLLIGNRMVPKRYPLPEPSYILWNKQGVFESQKISDLVSGYEDNIVNDISVSDVNSDGVPDILMVGEWGKPKLLVSEGEGWIASNLIDVGSGLWFSSAFVDLNNDGRMDIILGNVGENTKYSVSEGSPLRIYAGNIDENDTWDMYLSKKWKGKYVPFRGKECSTEQMPFVSEKFPTYEGFANAEIQDIIGSEDAALYQSEVNTLSSIALIANEDGGYSSVKLPPEAQLLPILDIDVAWGNAQKSPMVIIAGNIYDTEVETPRLDFHGGLVLQYGEIASNKDQFEIIKTIPYSADAKSIDVLKISEKVTNICIGINNGPVQTFDLN